MKRSLLVLALVVFAASTAFAAVQDFGAFTIDVPAGWSAERDEETVVFLKDDNSASMSITYDTLDGATLKEAAEAYCQELNGKNLKEEGETYTFEMTNENGVKSSCVISGDDKNYALIVMTGIENAKDEFSAMLDSLTEK